MRNCCRILLLAPALLLVPTLIVARIDKPPDGKRPEPQRVRVLDGSTVHNVGELQMHVGNWGVFGSRPNSNLPYAEAPSAQWPAGSATEYLFTAGLWVGSLKNGVPAVSTAAFDQEFYPSQDMRDVMYRAAEGSRGGNRLPSPTADDDRDGEVDEDWLNGWDDDNDGQIDEDFAAVSRQMFSCQYQDNFPISVQVFPQHNPLNIHVRQESYQWEEDRYDDFIGMQFYITNVGNDVLNDVYVGYFADADAGNRDEENYFDDDGTGFVRSVRCPDLGPVSMDIAYVYDVDGDDGKTEGYLGVLFLGHTTDPNGEFAPRRVGVTTYANFSGTGAYEDGGDPNNDFQRYELLSSEVIERDATVPRDYRMLMAAGPFAELLPGSTLVFQTAFAIGLGTEGMLENASSAQFTFEGAWFNLDGDRTTGVAGRETRVDGPADGIVVDSCAFPGQIPQSVPRGTTLWVNNDCDEERAFQALCNYTELDSALFRTGIGGNEAQIFWMIGTAPPPPAMRLDAASAGGVTIYWDNFSETQPDVKTQKMDFEGYRVFRADNWQRPLGTSSTNGPGTNLWKMLFEVDVRNAFGADTGTDRLRYEPLTHIPAGKKADMIKSIEQYLTEFPANPPPCPQGVTPEECDSLWALAAWNLGLPEGRQYYRYVDRAIHRGRPYFYAVTATDHSIDDGTGAFSEGKAGDPASNFAYVEPQSLSQPDYNYHADHVYVVPNPATTESMQPWTLGPNNNDPTGLKVEFRNLPSDRGTIRIYTVAGDLVEQISFDGRTGDGSAKWDLVTRNGQDVTSGVYIFSVETDTNATFKRNIGKFVVIR